MKSIRFRGPSLTLLAIANIVVFAAGLVAAGILRHGGGYVTPFAPAEQLRQFFAESPEAVRVSSLFLFGSAVPLGIFAATIASYLRFLGVRAAGISIALFGGLTASIAVFLSGIASWMLSIPEITASAPLVKAIAFFSFLCGGVFFAVGFGLLAAGVSVTSYFARVLPRWLAGLGMLVAIAGELSWFSLVAFPANFFIPITRYIGLIWMILAAVALTRNRRAVPSGQSADAA